MSEISHHITLQVQGMDCANCALGITRKLSQKGHSAIQVNFATGEASLDLAPGSSKSQVIEAIETLGYHVIEPSYTDISKRQLRLSVEQRFWFCLVFTIPLFFGHLFFAHSAWINQALVQLILCIPVMVIGGFHFIKSAWLSLRSGVPNMDVLIAVGSVSAFVYSCIGMLLFDGHDQHNYLFFETAATIITLVLLGNLLEQRSVKRTTSAIDELTQLQPTIAHRIRKHGEHEHLEEISASELRVGDLIQINTGDSIPADAEVITGTGAVNESMLTGESIPVNKDIGHSLATGTVVMQGPLRAKVIRIGGDTLLARIIALVKDTQQSKPPIQQLADRISAVFVPIVLGIALLTFAISYWWVNLFLSDALLHSIAVLVISCPCAMGLATPTAVMVGLGRAARKGILIRGSRTLELLADVRTVVFDKTGTLTTGKFSAIQLNPLHSNELELVKSMLFALEKQSSHPLAQSIVSLLEKDESIDHKQTLLEVRELPGIGIQAKDAEGNIWKAGSWRLLNERDKAHSIYLMRNNELVATADLIDEIRPGTANLIQFLHRRNIKTVLLSGDRFLQSELVARQLGIQTTIAEQLPEQKLEHIARLSLEGRTIMVGDGINDAPALARADVGVSAGQATPVALQSAQVVLLGTGDLDKLRDAILIGRHTLLTIRQNLFWAFFYNILAIPLAAFGLLSPMIAALSMAFSDVIVIGNSIRLRTKKLS